MAKKMDRRTQYTQMVLKDSLMKLMEKDHIDRITVKTLCLEADVNRTTFYAHYGNIYELLDSIEAEILDWSRNMVNSLIANTGKEETLKLLEEVLIYLSESKKFQILMSSKGSRVFQEQLLSTVYKGCAFEKTTSMTPLDLVFAVHGSIGLIQCWIENDTDLTPQEIAKVIYRMAVR